MTSPITTHVLDTSRGQPGAGIAVVLEREGAHGFVRVGHGDTDADGRLRTLMPPGPMTAGKYRLTFDVGTYFGRQNVTTFFGDITITFLVNDPAAHYHVPLLVSPFGYSTYRGS
jgi:5-hydroxyisourate hydrolase